MVSVTSRRLSVVEVAKETLEVAGNWQGEGLDVSMLEVDLMFFPEGGNLVTGLPSVLGIKATDANGVGQALTGSIYASDGNLVTEFETAELGLGVINLIPKENMSYYALVNSGNGEKHFELPTPMANGYSLNIKNRGDNVLLQVTGTDDFSLEVTLLIGHVRGELIFKRLGRSNNEVSYAVRLLTGELPNDVAQFILFSADGERICERLVLVDHPSNDAQVFLNMAKGSFGTREKVDIDITLLDAKNRLLQGGFSTSVFPVENGVGLGNMDLKGWLLLNSDLGVTVSDLGFFFKDDTKRTRYLLDALMLTHGWRRFVWKEILDDEISKNITYQPEKGIMVTGMMPEFHDSKKTKAAMAKFNVLGDSIEQEQMTDENGRFRFGPYFFNDSITAVLQAIDSTRRSIYAQKSISISLEKWPNVPDTNFKKENILQDGVGFMTKDSMTYTGYPSSYFDVDQEVIQLEAVSVAAKKKTRTRIIDEALNRITSYGRPDVRIFRDSVPGWETISVLELVFRRVLNLGVGVGSLNKQSSPLFLIDGVSTGAEMIRGMRATEVVYVDVLKNYNPNAAIYGARGSAGVIAIYANQPKIPGLLVPPVAIPGIKTAKVTGFYKAREFYSPKYSELSKPNTGADYCTTLFWNPKVEIDKQGRSIIQFYTGDVTGDFIVEFEGITNDGRLVTGSHYFTVANSL